jgi:hypothetical protein
MQENMTLMPSIVLIHELLEELSKYVISKAITSFCHNVAVNLMLVLEDFWPLTCKKNCVAATLLTEDGKGMNRLKTWLLFYTFLYVQANPK